MEHDHGTIVGEPSPEPVTPPEPLDPPAVVTRPRPKTLGPVEAVVRAAAEMHEAYLKIGCGRHAESMGRLAAGIGLRQAARAVLDAGVDPAEFVVFVCLSHARRKHKLPLPQQVFGSKAVASWLPEYRRSGHAADQHTREASPERAAAYAERARLDQLPRGCAKGCHFGD